VSVVKGVFNVLMALVSISSNPLKFKFPPSCVFKGCLQPYICPKRLLLWFKCIPQKLMYWKLSPQVQIFIVFGAEAFER
jgi:hypothetical protein